MSLAYRGVGSSNTEVEELPDDPTPEATLGPPLDSIVAQSAREKVGAKPGASKTKAPRPSSSKGPRTEKPRSSRSPKALLPPGAVVVGTFVGLGESGEPLVNHALNATS